MNERDIETNNELLNDAQIKKINGKLTVQEI